MRITGTRSAEYCIPNAVTLSWPPVSYEMFLFQAFDPTLAIDVSAHMFDDSTRS